MDFNKYMIKGIGIRWLWIIIFWGCSDQVSAQVLGGIFSQKSIDLKVVGQQIALLQVYEGWLQKGYHIARQKLTLIGDIKEGEFNLHANRFSRLKMVNPNLLHSSVVEDILQQETGMRRYALAAQKTGGLKGEEISFVQKTADHLIADGLDVLNDLDDLLSRGKETLTDNERLERLCDLDRDARNHKQLAVSLYRQATELNQQHLNDHNTLNELQWLYK